MLIEFQRADGRYYKIHQVDTTLVIYNGGLKKKGFKKRIETYPDLNAVKSRIKFLMTLRRRHHYRDEFVLGSLDF